MSIINAARGGRLNRVRELLRSGADPNMVDKYDNIALWWASDKEHLGIVRELLRSGADPNIANKYGNTPLHRASTKGYLGIVRELLRYGADPNIANNKGGTPLAQAAYGGRLKTVQVLLQEGAEPIIDYHNHMFPDYPGVYSKIAEMVRNYTPSLQSLAQRSIRKYRININTLPRVFR